MDGVFELETRYSRVEVWNKDALEEIDVIIGFTGDTLSVSLSSEQADAVAVALVQASSTEWMDTLDRHNSRLRVGDASKEERLEIGLALIRSAR